MEDNIKLIEEKMLANCKVEGFYPSKNLTKIARAKNMMFGLEEWQRCPCDGQNPDRYCGSDLCRNDVLEKGVCHCNCFLKEEPKE